MYPSEHAEVDEADVLGIPGAQVAAAGPDHVDPAADRAVGTGGHRRREDQEPAEERGIPEDAAQAGGPQARSTAVSTPPAVIAAAYQSLASVPRGRNCTLSMLGSAMPRKQAGIQTAS